MRMFEAAVSCESRPEVVQACKQQLSAMDGLSESELQQIVTEGREQIWPPLHRTRRSLTPLIDAGLKLCSR